MVPQILTMNWIFSMGRMRCNSSTSLHLFNFQKSLKKQFLFIKVNFTIDNFIFSVISMLVFGWITYIVPISWLPKETRRYIIQSNIRCCASEGSVSILGELIYELILVTITHQYSKTYRSWSQPQWHQSWSVRIFSIMIP